MRSDTGLARAQATLVHALVSGGTPIDGIAQSRLDALSRILYAKRRESVARRCPPLRRVLQSHSSTVFEDYARAHPSTAGTDAVDDAVGFLHWLRHKGLLPRELRFLALRLRIGKLAPFLCLCALLGAPALGAQLPLSPVKASGQTVTPVFEGWYRNPDGSYSVSFGYFNRNSEEALEIPVGQDNFVTPGVPNQGQPAHFRPRRHWGVFAVKVPADFGDKTVVWTLRIKGETFAIPASLHADWQIDALEGEAATGNTPPVLRFSDGTVARGPGGATAGPVDASAGKPLTLAVWASDDGNSSPSISSAGRQGVPVALTWFKHQGPGDVAFAPPTPALDAEGKATTTATFSRPGAYILRLRANDASGVANAGHAQCCWTNGFVKVTVGP